MSSSEMLVSGAAIADPSSDGSAGAAEPELCRVSVIGRNTQVDVGLPATVPIGSYVRDLVALIESHTPAVGDDEAAALRAEHFTLARIGRDPLSANQSLLEAGVRDGDLLVLRSVTTTESPALFDDVIDAVSQLTADGFRAWSPAAARMLGLMVAVVSVAAAIVVLLAAKGGGIGLGTVSGGGGVLAMIAATIASRRYYDRLSATMLWLCGTALLGATAALSTPGHLGSPHAMFAGVAALVAALAGYALTRAGTLAVAAVGTVGLLLAGAGLARMLASFSTPKIAAAVVVAALVLITMAPRVAVAAARLPVPPVPTAGGVIDPADHEPRPTIADIGAIGATALPSAAGLEQRVRAANGYQTGIIVGCAATASVAAVLAANPLGAWRWPAVALAAVVGVVLCLRGRSYADLTQAASLVVGGAVTLIVLLSGLALGEHGDWRLAVAGTLLAVAAVALAAGVVGPHLTVSPVWRRAGEMLEYGLIVAIVPLVLWSMDLYSAARNR